MSLHLKLSIAMFTKGANHEMRSTKLPDPLPRLSGGLERKFCVVLETWVERSTPDMLPRTVKEKFGRCRWPWWGDEASRVGGRGGA